MIAYAKNPVAELAILTNPHEPKQKKTMKRTTKRRTTRRNPSVTKRTKDLLIPAAGILGGMVAATQITRLASGFIPSSIQKIAAVGIPLAAGVALTGMGKSNLVKYIGIGAGAAGVSAGVRTVMPNLSFLPMSGQLADAMNSPAGYLPTANTVRLAPAETLNPANNWTPEPLADSQFIDDSGYLDENEHSDDGFIY
ncbi:MAG: hypothetical protein LAT57_00115 [Balneolales bacterium]|nr:hypothetical protein [Balneolales bacterium]